MEKTIPEDIALLITDVVQKNSMQQAKELIAKIKEDEALQDLVIAELFKSPIEKLMGIEVKKVLAALGQKAADALLTLSRNVPKYSQEKLMLDFVVYGALSRMDIKFTTTNLDDMAWFAEEYENIEIVRLLAKHRALPQLLKLLECENDDIKRAAIEGIGSFGIYNLKAVVPLELIAARSDNYTIAYAAFNAVIKMGPAAQVFNFLARQAHLSQIRIHAIRELANNLKQEAIPYLEHFVLASDKLVRCEATAQLALLGKPNIAAVMLIEHEVSDNALYNLICALAKCDRSLVEEAIGNARYKKREREEEK